MRKKNSKIRAISIAGAVFHPGYQFPFCQLKRSPEFLFLCLSLITAALFSGCQATKSNPTPTPVLVQRFWNFEKFTNGPDETVPIGGTHFLLGGIVDDRESLGPIAVTAAGEDTTARLEAFSNETGFTYWVASQAPSGQPLDDVINLGGDVDLDQYQYFSKQLGDASLHMVITEATLEAFDEHPNPPTEEECRWTGQTNPEDDCSDVMETDLELDYDICGLDATGQMDKNKCVNTNSIFAYLRGWRGHWRFVAGLGDGAGSWCRDPIHPIEGIGHPCIDWRQSDFDFSDDLDGSGKKSHALAKLNRKLAVDIPLDDIDVGEQFVVNIEVKSSSFNHRQGETYIGSKFRDPAKLLGLSFETKGVVPVEKNLPKPTPAVIAPAAPCSGAPDPVAGTIQFAGANYYRAELPGPGADVTITRSGGNKGDVSVLLTTSDGTAQAGKDYAATSKVIRFGDGDSEPRHVPIKVLTDKETESNETVQLTLADARGCARIGSQATSTLIILDDDGVVTPPPAFSIGGTLTGLTGSGLVIKDLIDGGSFTADDNGAFTLSSPTPILDGFPYDVVIATQPSNPDQSCTVANGTGTVSNADVTNIAVSCVTLIPSGGLDPTFGSAGRVSTSIPYSPGIIDARMGMALQADGKILMVGGTTLARFNDDGTLDSSFGTGGQVAVPFNQGVFDTAQDVAVQADGKIVVAGLTASFKPGSDDFALARFNSNGSLDTTFGSTGKVTTDFFGSTDQARRVRILPSGKILAAGFATRVISATEAVTHFALACYNADGSLDTGFGTGGKVDEAAGASFSHARGMAIQSDGKIIVAGSGATDGVSDPDVALTRLFGDTGTGVPGTRDDSFGPSGKGFDLTDLGGIGSGSEFGVDAVVTADDTILVAADVAVGPAAGGSGFNSQFTLVSFDKDDSQRRPQPAIVPITDESDRPKQILLQSDGKTVIVGRSGDLSSNSDMAVVRFNAGGLLPDSSFGTDGVLTIDFFGGRDGAEAVVQQPDGKLIVGGFARVGNSLVFALVRLLP